MSSRSVPAHRDDLAVPGRRGPGPGRSAATGYRRSPDPMLLTTGHVPEPEPAQGAGRGIGAEHGERRRDLGGGEPTPEGDTRCPGAGSEGPVPVDRFVERRD